MLERKTDIKFDCAFDSSAACQKKINIGAGK